MTGTLPSRHNAPYLWLYSVQYILYPDTSTVTFDAPKCSLVENLESAVIKQCQKLNQK